MMTKRPPPMSKPVLRESQPRGPTHQPIDLAKTTPNAMQRHPRPANVDTSNSLVDEDVARLEVALDEAAATMQVAHTAGNVDRALVDRGRVELFRLAAHQVVQVAEREVLQDEGMMT